MSEDRCQILDDKLTKCHGEAIHKVTYFGSTSHYCKSDLDVSCVEISVCDRHHEALK